jgi:hypothetical protein
MDQVILLAEWFLLGAAALHFSSIVTALVRFGRTEHGALPRLKVGGVGILLAQQKSAMGPA